MLLNDCNEVRAVMSFPCIGSFLGEFIVMIEMEEIFVLGIRLITLDVVCIYSATIHVLRSVSLLVLVSLRKASSREKTRPYRAHPWPRGSGITPLWPVA